MESQAVMTANNKSDSAWEETSWKGHRRAQHRAFYELTFAEKLHVIEEMADFSREIIRRKIANGEPYIDPDTGEPVRGSRSRQVGEDRAPYPKTHEDLADGRSSGRPDA